MKWRRRKPTPVIEEPARVEAPPPKQRVDPAIADALENPNSLGVFFPPSHRGEWIPRMDHE